MAYSSDESGQREVYVQPYPGPGGKWQISTNGGQEPVWNPEGSELFYRSGSRMMAVAIDIESGYLFTADAGVGAGQKRPPRLSYSTCSGPGGSRFANWANGLNGLRASWVD